MTGKILSTVLFVLFIIAVIPAAVVISGIFFPENRVVTPQINPVFSGQPPIYTTHTYPFQEGQVTIPVTVNGSVYEGAKSADKSVTIIGNVSENVWVADSYLSMVDDPAQEDLYRDLLGQFRGIKAQHNLDDDEYLELMTVYVQSLKYETVGENPAKFPVETVVDQAGDCDDKSVLLAGLLSREGYSVALLSFGAENHMAVGIGSNDYRYRNTSYTFLETTNISYVGVPTEKLGDDSPLDSVPDIIPVGNGVKIYFHSADTRSIHETMITSEQRATELEPQVKTRHSDLKEEEQAILEMESRMQDLKDAGRVGEYNALVSSHNAKVSVYNSDLNSYRQLYSRYEKYVNVYNYIIDHGYDRKGVYQYIQANPIG